MSGGGDMRRPLQFREPSVRRSRISGTKPVPVRSVRRKKRKTTMESIKEFSQDSLAVAFLKNRTTVGEKAADHVERLLVQALRSSDEVRVVFAAAPSQNEMLERLTAKQTIEWERVVAFHMDEYIGLPADSPQLFSRYLFEHLFSKVPFKAVHIINSQAADPLQECRRYAGLIGQRPIDLVCMGIGENGHIAFNDPPVADFNDPETVKVVTLDEVCRQQQVNDGCFPSTDAVPQNAITLTIPTLFSAKALSVVVPGTTKAEAVRQALHGPISIQCPASIIRRHPNAKLFADRDASSLVRMM